MCGTKSADVRAFKDILLELIESLLLDRDLDAEGVATVLEQLQQGGDSQSSQSSESDESSERSASDESSHTASTTEYEDASQSDDVDMPLDRSQNNNNNNANRNGNNANSNNAWNEDDNSFPTQSPGRKKKKFSDGMCDKTRAGHFRRLDQLVESETGIRVLSFVVSLICETRSSCKHGTQIEYLTTTKLGSE